MYFIDNYFIMYKIFQHFYFNVLCLSKYLIFYYFHEQQLYLWETKILVLGNNNDLLSFSAIITP